MGILKKTVDRLQRESHRLEVARLFELADAAANSHVGPSGFSRLSMGLWTWWWSPSRPTFAERH